VGGCRRRLRRAIVAVPARPGGGGGGCDGGGGGARGRLCSNGVGGLAWGRGGGLAAACWDNKVRLYQLRKRPAEGVALPIPGQSGIHRAFFLTWPPQPAVVAALVVATDGSASKTPSVRTSVAFF